MTKEDKDEIGSLLKEVADKHKEAIKQDVSQGIAAYMVDKQFAESQNKEFANKMEDLGIKSDTIKNLQDIVEKQGEAMRKFSENQEVKEKTIEQMVIEKATEIKALSSSRQGQPNLKLEIPASVVNKTQVTRASVSSTTMAMRLPGVGQLPYLGMKMANLFRHAPVSPSSNGVIRFYDQSAITRSAANTAEGATKPESAITWIERLIKVEKIADSIPVTKEAWQDVDFIMSEIDRLLNLNLALKEDQQIWNGDGNTPNLNGVFTTATVFDGTGANYANKFQNANIYDLIASVRVDVMNSKQSKYQPNAVVMNPLDILAYKLTKDSFGRYVIPPFVSADGSNMDGMEVIESSQVTADTLLVGDTRYGTIYDLEGVTIEMGYINDQFVKNAMTILAEKREALLIRNVDADGFRKVASISAQITNINKNAV